MDEDTVSLVKFSLEEKENLLPGLRKKGIATLEARIVRIRAIERADPFALLAALEEKIQEMPGAVEWNFARELGTSVRTVRRWRADCPDFDEALSALEARIVADTLGALATGQMNAKTADRICFVNAKEGIDIPRERQARQAALDLPGINVMRLAQLQLETAQEDESAGKG
jgi:hypothetical protein